MLTASRRPPAASGLLPTELIATSPGSRLIKHFCVPLLLCVGCVVAPSAHGERLEEVLRYTLQNHPRAQAANAGLRATEFQLAQARSGRAPRFSLIADPGRLYNRDSSRSSDVGDLGVRGSVLMYDGGRTQSLIARDQSRVAAAGALSELTADELAARVADVYVEWFKQERLTDLAQSNVEAHQALYDRVEQIASFDRGRASDLIQVGARLQQAKITVASRRGAANEAQAVLSDLVGREVARVEPLRDAVEVLPATLQSNIGLLETHPSSLAADAQARAAQQNFGLAAAWLKPRLDLQSTVNSPQDFIGRRQYFDNYDLRVAISWTPFDGGGGSAGARAAEQEFLQAKAAAQAVRRDLSARVAELWSQIATRRERAGQFASLVEQATAVREAYWQQFTIGRRSIIDLLNAENESFQARLGAASERLELQQTQYRLLAATSQLTSFLGVAPATERRP